LAAGFTAALVVAVVLAGLAVPAGCAVFGAADFAGGGLAAAIVVFAAFGFGFGFGCGFGAGVAGMGGDLALGMAAHSLHLACLQAEPLPVGRPDGAQAVALRANCPQPTMGGRLGIAPGGLAALADDMAPQLSRAKGGVCFSGAQS
jgi:hypothetical protein